MKMQLFNIPNDINKYITHKNIKCLNYSIGCYNVVFLYNNVISVYHLVPNGEN